MDQLTVRGFGDELGAAVRRLAAQEQISLNKAALRLLRRGAGLPDGTGRAGTVGSSLDHLIGGWSSKEADALDAALEDFGVIDESAWA